MNVEPSPGALFARISPPWDSAIWRAMESPRPAPPAAREGSVLWKRSKTRAARPPGCRRPCPRPRARRDRLPPQPPGDAPALRRVLHGVVQEYGGGLEDPVSVEGGPDLVLRGTYSTDTFPSAASLAACAASSATAPRSWRPTSRRAPSSPRVRARSDSTRVRILPASRRITRTLRRALSGSSSSAHSSSILAWPLMAVSGVRSSWLASAAKRRWRSRASSPAGEGGLQAREETVYRGGETPDFVPGIGHGQPLREVPLAHLPCGSRHGVYRPQGCSCQEVAPPMDRRRAAPMPATSTVPRTSRVSWADS